MQVNVPTELLPALEAVVEARSGGAKPADIAMTVDADQRRALHYYMFSVVQSLVANKVIVIFNEGPRFGCQQLAGSIAAEVGAQHIDTFHLGGRDFGVLWWPEDLSRDELCQKADWIHMNHADSVFMIDPVVFGSAPDAPNDESVLNRDNACWGLLKVSAPVAWDRTKGRDTLTDDRVLIANFDTGLYMEGSGHEDLHEQYIDLPAGDYPPGLDDYVDFPPALDPEIGGDPYDPSELDPGNHDPKEDDSHGTRTTGLIVANENNSRGIAGIAPDAQVVPLRIYAWKEPWGNMSWENDWFGKAADTCLLAKANGYNIRVVNLEIQHYRPWDDDNLTTALAILDMYSQDLVICGANGNIEYGYENTDYPGAFPEVFGVGPITYEGELPYYGRGTPGTSAFAPSDMNKSTMATDADDYGDFNGSSCATAEAAGIAALYVAANLPVIVNEPYVPQIYQYMMSGARGIFSFDVSDPDLDHEYWKCLDLGDLSMTKYHYDADSTSTCNCVALMEGGEHTLIALNQGGFSFSGQYGFSPELHVYNNSGHSTEIIPQLDPETPWERLKALDIVEIDGDLRVSALVTVHGEMDPEYNVPVHYYEIVRNGPNDWELPTPAFSITYSVMGMFIPSALDYERTPNDGSFAILSSSYLMGQPSFHHWNTDPGFSLPAEMNGTPRAIEMAAENSRLVVYANDFEGGIVPPPPPPVTHEVWLYNGSSWLRADLNGNNGETHISDGEAYIVRLGSYDNKTGWITYAEEVLPGRAKEVNFQVLSRTMNFQEETLTMGWIETEVKDIWLLGNHQDLGGPYIAYRTSYFRDGSYYGVVEGLRYKWGWSGYVIARETIRDWPRPEGYIVPPGGPPEPGPYYGPSTGMYVDEEDRLHMLSMVVYGDVWPTIPEHQYLAKTLNYSD